MGGKYELRSTYVLFSMNICLKISMELFVTGFTKHTKRAGFARCRNSQFAGSATENHLRRLRKISRTNYSKKCPYML